MTKTMIKIVPICHLPCRFRTATLPNRALKTDARALGPKRRKIALARSGPASRSVEAFFLDIDRYIDAVKNLGVEE